MPAATRSEPTFALALGGGGARGLAHIHVLEALDELGIKPVVISGTSIGAIFGASYAAGMSGKEIREFAATVLTRPTEFIGRLWKVKAGIRKAWNIEQVLRAFLPPQVPATFEELKIPLHVCATDFYGHQLHVITEGDLVSAVGASAALPAVFEPIWRDDRMLIDGGFYAPVPYEIVLDKADLTIAIDVVGAPERNDKKTPGRIDLMYGSSQLVMQSVIDQMLLQSRPAIFLRPPVSRFRVLDFLKFDQVMSESVSIKDDLKRAIDDAVDARHA